MGVIFVPYQILDQIHSSSDLARFSIDDLRVLSGEMQQEIIRVVANNGGHLAPNLGVIDLTIALHKVFHTPEDKIIFDVGHQSYPHKILTGRKDDFENIRLTNGISGFTKSKESIHDAFGAGHAGTAISAAMGFAAARDLRKSDEHVIAVVGDGALVCGISLEALNNVRSTCKNLIIVLNDNKMSISKSIGAIPNYLNSIITGRSYNKFKAFAKMAIAKMPAGGDIIESIQKFETSTKSLFVPGVFFEDMGLRYVGPINGHQLPELIQTFESVKHFKRPVIVHVITEKGHGCEYAVHAPEKFHGVSSFDPLTGKCKAATPAIPTFSATFGKTLCELAEKNSSIIGITAAMSSGTGMSEFADRFHERFFDTGIAEEHALVFAAGLAAAGMRPVVAIYATFLQRALDCIFHDVCLQNLPVVICADRAGIVEDGPTHHGIYDTSFLLSMPNLSILAPRNERELASMLPEAVAKNAPVVIRYPRGNSAMSPNEAPPTPIQWGRAEVVREGKDLALWTLGRELYSGLKVADILQRRANLNCAVVSARFMKPFDHNLLETMAAQMPIVTIEDNCKNGGLASLAAETLVDLPHYTLLSFGWEADQIVSHGSTEDLRRTGGMLPEQIAESILQHRSSQ